jgi:serine/threonine-protein kinase
MPLPSPGDGVPAQLGRYHLEEEIAHGGVGIVLRAHDDAFHRSLAVKVLLEKHRNKPDIGRRFLEEAQVMGQLQHPGIPPVYDLGELPDGRPFFAMKLIQGRTLAELLKERPEPAQDLPQFLAIFGQVCQAVAYAHSRGILHRDLKPSNIMVGAFGEVQVTDWGLAKVLGSARTSETGIQPEDTSTIATARTAEDEQATHEGAILGTPGYMAPEQARGEIERLDERADVFGLGAVLCVLLTGKPPYVAPTKAEVYRQAKAAALTNAYARLKACGADEELVRLAKACLMPDLAERPRHAGVVAEAVAAYQTQVRERLQQAEVERAAVAARAEEAQARATAETQARQAAEAQASAAQAKVAAERRARRLTAGLAAATLLLGSSTETLTERASAWRATAPKLPNTPAQQPAHASTASPKAEASLSRKLRTSPLPATHAALGNSWQNRGLGSGTIKTCSPAVASAASCRTSAWFRDQPFNYLFRS